MLDIADLDGGSRLGEPQLVRIDWARRLPREAHALIGIAAVTAIAALDWLTGPAVSVAMLYVLAVMGVTWLGTCRHGYLVAVLASVESLAVAVTPLGGTPHSLPVAAWNATARLVVLIAFTWLLGRLRGAIVRQRRQAAVDPLTGALNRRAFQEAAERERLRSIRDGTPLSIGYLDIDRFKAVNDRHGHRAGDRILQALASTVNTSIRGSDLLARIGGDEFVLLLPATDARDAVSALQRVQARLRSADWGVEGPVEVSIGVATYRVPPTDVDAMVDEADTMMYRAKGLGGDRTVGAVIAGPWVAPTPGPTVEVRIDAADVERVAG